MTAGYLCQQVHQVPTWAGNALGTGPSTSCLGILREKRFTFVEFAADLPPMLFDHDGQGEFENVADKPEYAAELARLTRAMLPHRMRNMDHTLSLDTITRNGPRSRLRYARAMAPASTLSFMRVDRESAVPIQRNWKTASGKRS